MRTFDILIGHSIGDIIFGMSREDARLLLGDYREFKASFEKQINPFDQFSLCNLGYDKNNKVEYISFHTFQEIELKLNDRIISNMTPLELFSYINKLDNNVDIEEGGVSFESDTLGISASFEKTPVVLLSTEEEILCEKLESITIAKPGYWSK